MSLETRDTPWKPATMTTAPVASASEMRPGVTAMMRALPWVASVMMPAWLPVRLVAVWPCSWMAMASRAIEMRSPAVSSMSSSRPGGMSEISLACRSRLSVVLPMADTTTTTSLPACLACTTRSATRLMRSVSATDEPPYFCTTIMAPSVAGSGSPTRCPPDHLRDGRANIAVGSDLATAGEGASQGDLVGVLKVAAHRQPRGDAADPQGGLVGGQRLEQPRQVARGRLTLDVGVGGEHHLRDRLLTDARQQVRDAELVRPHTVDRGDRPTQHVVTTAELPGLLHRHQVTRLLDDAQHMRVPARVAADAALLLLGDVVAAAAEAHPALDLADRPSEPVGVGHVDGQQVEGQALRALGTDPRKTTELGDEVLDRTLVHGLEQARRKAHAARHAARHAAEQLLLEVLRRPQRLHDRRGHHVLQHLHVFGVHDLRIDGDALDLTAAGGHDGDHPAAGAAGHLVLGQALLRLHQFPLQRLSLLHHLVHVPHGSSLCRRSAGRAQAGRRLGVLCSLASGLCPLALCKLEFDAGGRQTRVLSL